MLERHSAGARPASEQWCRHVDEGALANLPPEGTASTGLRGEPGFRFSLPSSPVSPSLARPLQEPAWDSERLRRNFSRSSRGRLL